MKPDLYFNVSKYVSMYGANAAAEVANFEATNVYAVKELVEAEKLDCDFHLTRAIDVYLDADHARQTEEAWEKLRNDKVFELRDVACILKEDAERVSTPVFYKDLRNVRLIVLTKVSGVKGAQLAFSFTAAHLWPRKMVHQLLAKLLKQDHKLNVQANTPVISVSEIIDETGKWTIETPRGTVKAGNVIHATNGYASQVLPEYTRSITPIRGVCSHIDSPSKQKSPHFNNTYALRFDGRNYDYLIPRADGSIIVGGARQRFWHKPERWFNNVRDDELVDEASSYFDGYMQRHFRGWEDTQAETKKVWTGSKYCSLLPIRN